LTSCCWSTAEKTISNGSLNHRSNSSCHWIGAEDQDTIDGFPELHLLDEKARHDRLAGTGIVSEEKAQPRLRQHFHVNRLAIWWGKGANTSTSQMSLTVMDSSRYSIWPIDT
jgi:hypothetical protein